ncbi:hypothetical protein JCM30566_05590 [Marinitoga arctica]
MTSATLTWQISQDPNNDPVVYDVYLGTDENSLELIKENLNTTTLVVNNLENDTNFYWKVVAKDDKGGYSESNISTFKYVKPGTLKWKFKT